jgi:aromatic-L-amino-acid decarboxylase
VAADAEYRMRPDALAEALAEVEAAAVVATVGTTSTSSVDPVPEIAALCAGAGAWLHVDAAYAGSAMVCEENRWAFAGVERADSLVVNPHKWLLTPIDCSLLYTRRPDVLREAFSIAPVYLRSSEEGVTNLTDYGPALGRRFRSLKLWAVIRCYGRKGLQRVIRDHQRLARLFASWVEEAPGWVVVAPVPFSLVCFRRDGSDDENRALLDRVNATGEAYLSHTVLDGRYVLRLAVGHHRTTEDDVRRAWELLQDR